MLYLSRKVGESVIINNTIEVTVVEVRGRTAKLGFTFPAEATVLRKEVHERISEQNIAASQSVSEDMFDDLVLDLNKAQQKTIRTEDESD